MNQRERNIGLIPQLLLGICFFAIPIALIIFGLDLWIKTGQLSVPMMLLARAGVIGSAALGLLLLKWCLVLSYSVKKKQNMDKITYKRS